MVSWPNTDSARAAQPETVSRTGLLALAGLAGPLWFTVVVIVQGILLPDYSHVKMPISALAAWPTGWIQILNFCVFGTLMIAFAVGLNAGIQESRRGAAGFPLLVLSGIGIVIAGLFPWKMINGVPTETTPHVAGAIISFAAGGFGLIVLSRRLSTDPRWRSLSTYTLSTGITVLLLFVVLGIFAIDNDTPLHPWAGLIQRVLCATWFVCLIVLACRLRRLAHKQVR